MNFTLLQHFGTELVYRLNLLSFHRFHRLTLNVSCIKSFVFLHIIILKVF